MNIVTIKDLEHALDNLVAAMAAKGLERPRPQVEFKADSGRVCGWLHAESLIGDKACVSIDGYDISDLMKNMMAYIERLDPTGISA
tara:strand:+ start:496 stop:753 length:258 start_codon:yes stop_codon:yes gene_type:complete